MRLANAERAEQNHVLGPLDERESGHFLDCARGAPLAKPKSYCSSVLMLGSEAILVSV